MNLPHAIAILLLLATSASLGADAPAAEVIRPGDHVAIVGNTFADQMRQYGYLETLLLQRLRGESISLRNLGWAGDTLTQRDRPTNFPTEDETLTDHETDVILICFGMSESFAGEIGLADFREDYQRLIDHYLSQKYNGASAPRLALVSPIACEYLGALTPHYEERAAALQIYTKAIGEIAAANGLAFVDLHEPLHALLSRKNAPRLTINGVHLTPFGYWIAAQAMADALVLGPEPWRIELDFKSREASSTGLAVDGVEAVSGGLRLTVTEKKWPAPAAPRDPAGDPRQEAPRDVLAVANLPEATHTLTIDGQPVATATAEEWARGVALDASPTHREVEAYRAAVNDKNDQFFYSWKALNQVHIVGERMKSDSGKALPAEVIEFNKLAIEKDKSLRTLGDPERTREWRLIATPEGAAP